MDARVKVSLDLTIGPLRIILNPDPELEDEPAIQAIGAAESNLTQRDDHAPPGLHVGFRGGYYED